MRCRSVFHLLSILIVLAVSSIAVLAQETAQASVEFSDEQLLALSEEELESICLVRGFEIRKDAVDPQTGDVYKLSHEDYVDAAKQCLAIEKEMNDLLEEHPELREELEDEIKAMQEEQAARRAEVEGLQEQLSESETKASDASGSENTAFVSRNQNKEESSDGRASAEEHVATSEQGATADDGEANANLDIDISEEEPIVEEEILEQIVDEVDDVVVEDVLQDQESATDEEKSEPTTTSDDASVGSTNEAVAKEETSNKDDLTLAAFVEEFVEYIRNDIQKFHKTFQQYVLPVIQPMFKAGNTAVKYIKAAVMTIQKEYNERAQQAEKEEAGQSSTEV